MAISKRLKKYLKENSLPVYADTVLAAEKNIVFNAESHTDTVQISFRDFQRFSEPKMGDISGPSS